VNVLVMTLGSHGDVHPFLGIASSLKARGHTVKFFANVYYESLVRAIGVEFVPIGTAAEFEAVARDPKTWHWFAGFKRIGKSIGSAIRPYYQAVLEHAVAGQTVLVYSTLCFGTRLAQETLRLPGVSVHLSPAVFFSSHAPPVIRGMYMPAWLPRGLKRALFGLTDKLTLQRIFGRPVNAFRAELNLPPVRSVMGEWCHSPQRVIGLFPDWYAPPQSDWPPQTVLTGFPLWDEQQVTPISPQLEEFLNSGSPPIAFTPGSAMFHGQKFFSAAIDACQRMNRRGLLLTRHAEQIPADLPASVLHIPFAPFGPLLPRCAAVVHHGGIGSTAQGLAAGIPQLLMPMSFDQPDNAQRVKNLGVGDWLGPRRFTGGNVSAALGRLIGSHNVAAACRSVAEKFAGSAPLIQTARYIEQVEGKIGL